MRGTNLYEANWRERCDGNDCKETKNHQLQKMYTHLMRLVKIFGDNWNESPFLYLMVTRWIIEIGKQFPPHVLTNRQQLQNLNYCHYNNTWQGKHWILLKSWTFCSFMFDDGLVLVVKVKVGSVLVTGSITGKQYLESNYLAVRCRGRGGWMDRKTVKEIFKLTMEELFTKIVFPSCFAFISWFFVQMIV